MKRILINFICISLMLSYGCSASDEQAIRDSRVDFMLELKKSLDSNNVPYKMDSEGYLRYSNKYKDVVQKTIKEVDSYMSTEVGTKFADKETIDYFRKLLDEYKISYRVGTDENIEWTYWHPMNKDQESEIEMKVVNYHFEQKK